VPHAEIERRRAIPGDIGNAVNAPVVLFEKPEILETVPGQPIVAVGEAEADGCVAMNPSQLSEGLADFRWRVFAPAVLAEQVAGEIPVQSLGINPPYSASPALRPKLPPFTESETPGALWPSWSLSTPRRPGC